MTSLRVSIESKAEHACRATCVEIHHAIADDKRLIAGWKQLIQLELAGVNV